MELSPRSVANTSFKTVKKGYDPADVRAYLESVAKAIEGLQSHAATMESRARAALARLQEIAAQPAQPTSAEESAADPTPFASSAIAESETISRTLLLAQRTADATVAEATAEAEQIRETADEERRNLVDGAREAAQRMLDDAVEEARRAGEGQRIEVENEVHSLLARREFLIGDVDHLELHIAAERDRLRSVAAALTEIASRSDGGLGESRRPLVSAVGALGDSSDDMPGSVYDALEASSAMSALDVTSEADDIEPLSVPEPVTLTPIVEPELDPTGSGRVDAGTSGAANDEADVNTADATPANGQPTLLQFDEYTDQTPPAAAETDPTIRGDALY